MYMQHRHTDRYMNNVCGPQCCRHVYATGYVMIYGVGWSDAVRQGFGWGGIVGGGQNCGVCGELGVYVLKKQASVQKIGCVDNTDMTSNY